MYVLLTGDFNHYSRPEESGTTAARYLMLQQQITKVTNELFKQTFFKYILFQSDSYRHDGGPGRHPGRPAQLGPHQSAG